MDPWHIRVIPAVASSVLKIFTPGLGFAAVAVGCLASALASFREILEGTRQTEG